MEDIVRMEILSIGMLGFPLPSFGGRKRSAQPFSIQHTNRKQMAHSSRAVEERLVKGLFTKVWTELREANKTQWSVLALPTVGSSNHHSPKERGEERVARTQSCSWRGGQPARTHGLLKRDTVIGNGGPSKGGGEDQGNKYLSISLQPLILYQYLPLAQSNQKPMSKMNLAEASCREQLLRDAEQRTEGGSGPGGRYRDCPALQEGALQETHSWRLEKSRRRQLGILFPGWDLSYYAGRKAKAIQLFSTPSSPLPPPPSSLA